MEETSSSDQPANSDARYDAYRVRSEHDTAPDRHTSIDETAVVDGDTDHRAACSTCHAITTIEARMTIECVMRRDVGSSRFKRFGSAMYPHWKVDVAWFREGGADRVVSISRHFPTCSWARA